MIHVMLPVQYLRAPGERRMEPHKRQHLLIEAMRHTKSAVKLRLCGRSAGVEYAERLRALAAQPGLEERVILEDRWIIKIDRSFIQALDETQSARGILRCPRSRDALHHDGVHTERDELADGLDDSLPAASR